MKYTEYSEINDFLDTTLKRVQEILSENFVGMYIFGSLVWGDYDEGISDVDLLVIIKNTLDDNEFKQLEHMHHELIKQYKNLDNRIEIAYAHTSSLKTFKTQTSEIAVISPGEPFHRKEAGIDWLINWYNVLEQSKVLYGPNPRELIEPISKEEFIERVKDQAKEWDGWVVNTKDSRPYQGHAILTMCRALYACRNGGQQTSKKRAAEWAVQELPEWKELIENALRWREEHRNRDIDHSLTYGQTEIFVKHVASII